MFFGLIIANIVVFVSVFWLWGAIADGKDKKWPVLTLIVAGGFVMMFAEPSEGYLDCYIEWDGFSNPTVCE